MVTLTSRRRSASAVAARRERHAEDGGALRRAAARAASVSTNVRVEQPVERLAERVGARDAVEALERLVPADDAIVEADDEQPVVERLEDVLVEGAQPIELGGLDVQLPIEPAVFDRRRRLSGHRGQQPMSSLVSGSPVSRRPSANTAFTRSFETHGTR